ncbi:MAG: hypothetical protein M3254_04945, partial [Actinomycetota bacterium]|nr:hypothetical protein [Actinomycetota bacterium]
AALEHALARGELAVQDLPPQQLVDLPVEWSGPLKRYGYSPPSPPTNDVGHRRARLDHQLRVL